MNFFYGRYGIDVLSLFLVIISGFFNFNRYTNIIGLILLLIAVFRTFSKNISKRTSELYKFIGFLNKILNRFGKSIPYNLPVAKLDSIPVAFAHLKYKFTQYRKYKIVSCPNCGQKLRLPRGQKKIIVTCKRCSHEFRMKT